MESATITSTSEYGTSSRLLTGSTYPERVDSDSSSGPPAGLIAGVVVGAVAAMALLVLGVWLLRRRRRRCDERDRVQSPDPYPITAGTSAAVFRKGDVVLQTPQDNAAPEGMPQQALDDWNSDDYPPAGQLEHDDDGSEVVEFLPPQYRETWQLSPASSPAAPLPAPEDSQAPQAASGPGVDASVVQPGMAWRSQSSGAGADSSKPSLKQQYQESFGSGPGSPDANRLRGEYKREFGSPREGRSASHGSDAHIQ